MRFVDAANGSVAEAMADATAIVCASGYEPRARALLKLVPKLPTMRFVLAFEENAEDLERQNNDRAFRDKGFQFVPARRDDPSAVQGLMDEVLAAQPSRPLRLVVDISSMSRMWYSQMIRFLSRSHRPTGVDASFLYVPSHFLPPPAATSRNELVTPIPGFGGLSLPDRPVALVLGLGYEPERALALLDLLDPAKIAVLIPHRRGNDAYLEHLKASNAEVLEEVSADWRFDFLIEDPGGSFRILESVVRGLLNDFSVVLTALGPKIFGLQCLLLASKCPEASVWWISGGRSGVRAVQADLERVTCLRTQWAPEALRSPARSSG